MKRKHSLSKTFLVNIVTLTICSTLLIGSLLIVQRFIEFNKESKQLKNNFMNNKKQSLIREVERTIQFIQFKKSTTEQHLKEDIKGRVYEAYNLITHLYEKNKDTMTENEIKDVIKETLRPMRFNDERGYYFIVSLDGVEVLYPTNPEYEGMYLYDLKDEKGNYVIRDEIKTAKNGKEGFTYGFWRKPEAGNNMVYPKITFVKLFEPYNWIIGTGEYLDEIEKEIKKDTLNRIRDIRFGEFGYVFVVNYEGELLTSLTLKEKENTNIWDLEDKEGYKFVRAFKNVIDESPDNNGFVKYLWKKPNEDKYAVKLTYIKGVDDWGWMIGSGLYFDEINAIIDKNKSLLIRSFIHNIVTIVFFIIVLTSISLIIARIITRKVQFNIRLFTSFFHKASTKNIKINKSMTYYREFHQLAESANKMIKDKEKAYSKLKTERERFFSTLEALPMWVYLQLPGYGIAWANQKFREVFGNPGNKKCYEIIRNRETSCEICPTINLFKTKNTYSWEFTDSKGKTYMVYDKYFPDFDGTPMILESGWDITERKKSEEKVKSSLKEKEILLKEIHHRVKNNLQIIISLLRLQSRYIKDKETLQIFEESKDRIKSMALIHEQLYGTDNLSEININDYIQNLLSSLLESYKDSLKKVDIKLDTDDKIKLKINTAIPCGLIINELITNSLKYAFPNKKRGTIFINLNKKSGESNYYELIVGDDGVGLKQGMNEGELNEIIDSDNIGFGLKLVKILTGQIDGNLHVKNKKGVSYTIVFEDVIN